MKIIDGEIYVNKEDAMNAMLEEMKHFEEKDKDAEILFTIGLTITSYISILFKTEGSEHDEH